MRTFLASNSTATRWPRSTRWGGVNHQAIAAGSAYSCCAMSTTPAALRTRLAELLPRDERRLQRRLDGTRKIRDEAARAAVLAEISTEADAAFARLQARLASVPKVTYPEALP